MGTWPPRIKDEVGKWLSDWHLVAFLCFQGLFSLVGRLQPERCCVVAHLLSKAEQQTLCRAATSHAHKHDKGALNDLFATGGWQTLITLAESTRT